MKRILVLDDSESILFLYALEFADEGYQVYTGTCNQEIFARIEQINPDIIVFDRKPWDGHRELLACQIQSRYPTIPLILCSAFPQLHTIWKPGFSKYSVAKSSDLTELKRMVANALTTELDLREESDLSALSEHPGHFANPAGSIIQSGVV